MLVKLVNISSDEAETVWKKTANKAQNQIENCNKKGCEINQQKFKLVIKSNRQRKMNDWVL